MLFNKLPSPDSSRTQLAYILNYYPTNQIPGKTLDVHTRRNYIRHMTKGMILNCCNEDMTHMTLPYAGALSTLEKAEELKWFEIHWAFNNIPTEEEWNKKNINYLLRTEFRDSPITGPIVILSFGTVQHTNPAWAK